MIRRGRTKRPDLENTRERMSYLRASFLKFCLESELLGIFLIAFARLLISIKLKVIHRRMFKVEHNKGNMLMGHLDNRQNPVHEIHLL